MARRRRRLPLSFSSPLNTDGDVFFFPMSPSSSPYPYAYSGTGSYVDSDWLLLGHHS